MLRGILLSLLSDVLFDVTKNARDFFIRCEIEKTTWKTEITVENITRVVNQPTCCPGYKGQVDQYSYCTVYTGKPAHLLYWIYRTDRPALILYCIFR